MPAPHKRIRKAVFPVAGLGTRFLPATKAMPKEMLTVVDRPVIQHVVDEARAAGIEHFIFVTGRNKGVDRGPFRQPARARGDAGRARQDKGAGASWPTLCPAPAQTSFTRQQAPLGLGHAVWCARDIVGDEPFALLLARHAASRRQGLPGRDDRGLREHGGNHIAVVAGAGRPRRTNTASSASTDREGEGLARSPQMVEKPKPGTAPSNLHITGRYILQPEIFGSSNAGARRRRRNPAHRCHDRHAARPASRSTPCASTARSTTPAPRSASCSPTSPMAWNARISPPPSRRHRQARVRRERVASGGRRTPACTSRRCSCCSAAMPSNSPCADSVRTARPTRSR